MKNPPRARLRSPCHASFSLVEVTIALAIVGIVVVALLGLLSPGLNSFRTALSAQTAGEIFQRVIADAQETDFDTLLANAVETGGSGNHYYRLPLRYFDAQGTEVYPANPDAPTPAESQAILYAVRVRGSQPGDPDPGNDSPTYPTSLPGVSAPSFNPRNLTFLTVQVAVTGGTRMLAPLVDAQSFLISPALAAKSSLPVRTYAAAVARNGYRHQP